MTKSLNRLFGLLTSVTEIRAQADDALIGFSDVLKGTVRVKNPAPSTVLFYEAGIWERSQQAAHNVYCWDFSNNAVLLSHLRQGEHQPVFLVRFVEDAGGFVSEAPHKCRADLYRARLAYCNDGFVCHWSIHGPRKCTTIETFYS